LRRALQSLAALAFAAAAASCAAPPPAPLTGFDPSDPSAPTPAVRYRSAIEPYVSERPAAPTPWRERNEQVAPQPKPRGTP
jgi:hypothetical protein